MMFFKINDADRRWLRSWLRSNLIFVFVIGSLLLALRMETTLPVVPLQQASAAQTFTTAEGISVSPQGWRRTANGWEHTSSWRRPARPLNELILMQQQREPIWMQTLLRWLRELPPLMFATLQLAAIAAVVWIAELRKKTRQDFSLRV